MQLDAHRLSDAVLGLAWPGVEVPLRAIERLGHEHVAVMAAVPFMGQWCGWMRLRCDAGLAHALAERRRDPHPVRPGDLDDAVRALASSIADAIKPVLDPEAKMGPAALVFEGWEPRSCRRTLELAFVAGHHALAIGFDERIPFAMRRTDAFESDLVADAAAEIDAEADAVAQTRRTR